MLRFKPEDARPEALQRLAGHQARISRTRTGKARTHRAQVKLATTRAGWRADHIRPHERGLLKAALPSGRRCVYCEDNDSTLLDHLQPKVLYPGLTYEWTNLIPACATCNQADFKGEKAAVLDNPQAHGWRALRREDHLTLAPVGQSAWLNPRLVDPLLFLKLNLPGRTFLFDPSSQPGTPDYAKAHWTLETLQLNREPLRQAREIAFDAFQSWLEKLIQAKAAQDQPRVDLIKARLRKLDHPTVWAEMKRQGAQLPEIDALLNQVPEVLTW